MNREKFAEHFDHLINHCSSLLKTKGKEYAPAEDRLHNFAVAARMNGQTRAQACWGMATKHIISISDMVREAGPNCTFTDAQWEEKIGDALNYLLLLYCCVDDDRKELMTTGLAPDERLDKDSILK